jgi:hypothetical protein
MYMQLHCTKCQTKIKQTSPQAVVLPSGEAYWSLCGEGLCNMTFFSQERLVSKLRPGEEKKKFQGLYLFCPRFFEFLYILWRKSQVSCRNKLRFAVMYQLRVRFTKWLEQVSCVGLARVRETSEGKGRLIVMVVPGTPWVCAWIDFLTRALLPNFLPLYYSPFFWLFLLLLFCFGVCVYVCETGSC